MTWYPGKLFRKFLGQELTDEEYRKRKLDDAYYWLERNYGGKKVRLNPVSVLKENNRSLVPHSEVLLLEAMKLSEERLGLKYDWSRYEHYKLSRYPYWMKAEPILRQHGYQITVEQFNELLPDWQYQVEWETSEAEKINLVVHEAVEFEELKRAVGHWINPRDYQHKCNLITDPIERKRCEDVLMRAHLKADEFAKISF